MRETADRIRRFCLLSIFMVPASMFAGACWSPFPGMEYAYNQVPRGVGWPELILPMASTLGWISGLGVGVWWCIRLARVSGVLSDAALRSTARRCGVVAGLVSTVILHGGLAGYVRLVCGYPLQVTALFHLGVGLIVGAITGFLVGALGGVICVRLFQPRRPESSTTTVENDVAQPAS